MFWKLRKEENSPNLYNIEWPGLVIAFVVKIDTHKMKKEKKNKTKQNKERLKWKVEQGILCSQ